jgi:hypothetical protein
MSGWKSRPRGAFRAGVIAAWLTVAVCIAPGSALSIAGAQRGAPAARAASSATEEDIRDIRGPKFVLRRWLLPAIVAASLLLGLCAYGIWRRQRRRSARALLPFEIALQRLEEIRAMMSPSSAQQFSVMVSDIVRSYIEQRFDVTATRRTTEEFLHDLLQSSNTMLVRYRAPLGDFLQQCDIVKFAGVSLTMHNMESLHRSACSFVRETAQEAHDPLSST